MNPVWESENLPSWMVVGKMQLQIHLSSEFMLAIILNGCSQLKENQIGEIEECKQSKMFPLITNHFYFTLKSWFTSLEQTALNHCQPLPTPYRQLLNRKQEHVVYYSFSSCKLSICITSTHVFTAKHIKH